MDEDQTRRNTIRSALIGKTDALRQLFGMTDKATKNNEPEIPVLHDMLESALDAGSQSVEQLVPADHIPDADSIPLLTETADGQVLVDDAPDLRAQLQVEADDLLEEVLSEFLTAFEQQLRERFKDVCEQHIDSMLAEIDKR